MIDPYERHVTAAEESLSMAMDPDCEPMEALLEAQVHATLALAAAVKESTNTHNPPGAALSKAARNWRSDQEHVQV